MRLQDTGIQVLPEIQMYGGDTTSWRFYMQHASQAYYSLGEATGYSANVYIIPYYMQTGVSINGTPVLTKAATMKEYDGIATAEFEFATADTIALGGKYIYQIEFIYGTEKRVGQGSLYIHPNINRPTS